MGVVHLLFNLSRMHVKPPRQTFYSVGGFIIWNDVLIRMLLFTTGCDSRSALASHLRQICHKLLKRYCSTCIIFNHLSLY